MDYMDESHEVYRKTFQFLETTNTWHDIDVAGRTLPDSFQSMGCGYKAPSAYDDLANKAKDGFKMVVKVSCVGTHLQKLKNPQDWWPRLYWEKYSKLRSATVAFLWQMPPSFKYNDANFATFQ